MFFNNSIIITFYDYYKLHSFNKKHKPILYLSCVFSKSTFKLTFLIMYFINNVRFRSIKTIRNENYKVFSYQIKLR